MPSMTYRRMGCIAWLVLAVLGVLTIAGIIGLGIAFGSLMLHLTGWSL